MPDDVTEPRPAVAPAPAAELPGIGRDDLERQTGAMLQLIFTGTGYALGDTDGKVWPLGAEQERQLGVLFVAAHGPEIEKLLRGGAFVKVLAWGTLGRVIMHKYKEHRATIGERPPAAGDRPSKGAVEEAPASRPRSFTGLPDMKAAS